MEAITSEHPARGGNETEHTIRPPSRQSVQRGFRHWLRLDGDRSHGVDFHPLFRYQHLWARILACHPECRDDPSHRFIGRGHRTSVRRVGCCVRFRVGSRSLVSPVSEILTPWKWPYPRACPLWNNICRHGVFRTICDTVVICGMCRDSVPGIGVCSLARLCIGRAGCRAARRRPCTR